MAAVTAVTALNTFNGGFITASRFIYGTAREGSLPRQLAQLNDRAVPWVPVVVLGAVSAVVALVVALTHAWQVLVAVGAALEAMIYGVAGFCALRLRARQPDTPRPFRVRGLGVLGPLGIVLFGVLAVTASVSVQDHFNPAPLVIILVVAALSAFYVLRVLPGIKAREAARPCRPAPAPPDPVTGVRPLLRDGPGVGDLRPPGGCAACAGGRGGPAPGRRAPRSPSAKGMPSASQSMGNMEIGVKPGMVFTSLTTISSSSSRKMSTRASPSTRSAR